MLKKITLVLCMLFSIVVLQGCAKRVVDSEQVSPEQKLVIKFSHVVAENTPKGLAAQRFATLVQERTNGKVEVQVFPNSTLYKDGEEMDALREGAVQIIAPATSKLASMFPRWLLLDLPYAFENIDEVHRAMDGPIGKKLMESLEKQGLLPLAFWDNGFKQLTNGVRPLVKPEDMRGLKFRVMINSSVLQEQFRMVGAYPVPTPFNDVYRYLQNYRVHGQENTISNIYSKKFYEVQPYMTVTNHGYMGYVVLVDKRYWESLPEDVRVVLEKTMAEVTEWEHQTAADLNDLYLKEIQSTGKVEITKLGPEERKVWENAFLPLYERMAGKIGKELIDELANIK